MSDFQKYKAKRMKENPEAFKNYEKNYESFKIGAMLKLAREDAGLTQEQLAVQLKTKKSAISRIENHAEDIKLSTISKVAEALGKHVHLEIS